MKYSVILSAHGNPDHDENPYLEIVGGRKIDGRTAWASSIEECQEIVKKYIADNDLGSGNWTGGDVFEDGRKVGAISYNGRYWPLGSEYCK